MFVLPGPDKKEESAGCDVANALLLNLSWSPSSVADVTAPPPHPNTPCNYSTTISTCTTATLQAYDKCPSSQQRTAPTNTPTKDSTQDNTKTQSSLSSSSHQASSSVSSYINTTTTATHSVTKLAAVGNGDRQKPYKGSRVPAGVRPWLSQKLEQMWGIDGKVYSHYILSVLLDGVDNEFFVDDLELEELSTSRKPRPGSKKWTDKHARQDEELQSDDSFEARRKAVLNYLSSFSLDEVIHLKCNQVMHLLLLLLLLLLADYYYPPIFK